MKKILPIIFSSLSIAAVGASVVACSKESQAINSITPDLNGNNNGNNGNGNNGNGGITTIITTDVPEALLPSSLAAYNQFVAATGRVSTVNRSTFNSILTMNETDANRALASLINLYQINHAGAFVAEMSSSSIRVTSYSTSQTTANLNGQAVSPYTSAAIRALITEETNKNAEYDSNRATARTRFDAMLNELKTTSRDWLTKNFPAAVIELDANRLTIDNFDTAVNIATSALMGVLMQHRTEQVRQVKDALGRATDAKSVALARSKVLSQTYIRDFQTTAVVGLKTNKNNFQSRNITMLGSTSGTLRSFV